MPVLERESSHLRVESGIGIDGPVGCTYPIDIR